MHAVVDELHQHEIQVKGIAPVLLDFPGERAGRAVLWCWLEGDSDVRWYHRPSAASPAAAGSDPRTAAPRVIHRRAATRRRPAACGA
ncbi:DUF2203 family protein [Micromonospora sp. M12]